MRKNSKSLRKSSPSKTTKKKDCAKKCVKKQITPLNFQHSLYGKYADPQNFHYISIVNKFLTQEENTHPNPQTQNPECLEKYYKSLNRKHTFPKIKEVYKLHKEIPRIFQPGVKEILNKCYHRKRLLDYFKIAKLLRIKVESVKLSTFLLSVNDITNKRKQEQKKFEPIITKISTIDFSCQAERDLLQELNFYQRQSEVPRKQNWISPSNSESLIN